MDLVPKLIRIYNNTINGSIELRPNQENAKIITDAHEMMASEVQVKKSRYKLDDGVRIFKYKHKSQG